MTRLRLHVGTPKTGTTALQWALARSRERLREQGVEYPDISSLMKGTSTTNHNGLALALCDGDPLKIPSVAVLRDFVRERLAAGTEVVISAESLYSRVVGDRLVSPRMFGPDYWEKREQYAANLGRLCEGFDTQVVICLRRQDAYAESSYSELSKSFRESSCGEPRLYRGTFREFRERQAAKWGYDRQVALLERHIGPVTAVCFEKEGIEGVLEALRLDRGLAATAPRANTSTDARVVLWLAQFPFGTREEREAFGMSAHARDCFDDFGTPGLWESEEERSAFLERHADEKYGGGFFPAPGPLKPPAVLTPEDARRLTAAYAQWDADQLGARRLGLVPTWG